jgi:hypothetical protein
MWALFLDKKNGKISLTRVMSFMVVMVILGVYIVWNVHSMLKGGTYTSIGVNEVYLILVALGAKVTQNIFGEKPAVDKPKEVSEETPK